MRSLSTRTSRLARSRGGLTNQRASPTDQRTNPVNGADHRSSRYRLSAESARPDRSGRAMKATPRLAHINSSQTPRWGLHAAGINWVRAHQ